MGVQLEPVSKLTKSADPTKSKKDTIAKPLLSMKDIETKLCTIFTNLGKYGLIFIDCHSKNIMVKGDQVRLIDIDPLYVAYTAKIKINGRTMNTDQIMFVQLVLLNMVSSRWYMKNEIMCLDQLARAYGATKWEYHQFYADVAQMDNTYHDVVQKGPASDWHWTIVEMMTEICAKYETTGKSRTLAQSNLQMSLKKLFGRIKQRFGILSI